MATLLSHILNEEHLVLSNERTLFWENEKTLIVADLHVGKTGHFRKSGIGVPAGVYKEDLQRLLAQILFFKADRLVIAGDLTHSRVNREMDLFRKWRNDFPSLDVHLVRGNHDILDRQWYEEANVRVHEEQMEMGGFLFVHDIFHLKRKPGSGQFAFSGHVHPGITIRGKGKQILRFPCYYFKKNYCILPAFSRFTGTYPVEAEKEDQVYAIVEKEIVAMPLGK